MIDITASSFMNGLRICPRLKVAFRLESCSMNKSFDMYNKQWIPDKYTTLSGMTASETVMPEARSIALSGIH